MMFIKLVRLTKDAELRHVGNQQCLSVSVVYDVGYGDKKKGQFLNLTMWGDRSSKMVEYLTKGKQIVIRADDIHTEEYGGKTYLNATLASFEFVSERRETHQAEPSIAPKNPNHQERIEPPKVKYTVPFDDVPF